MWDVCGNMSEKIITFDVTTGSVPEIAASGGIDIYSEVSGTETTFYVRHNCCGAVVDVTVEVFDLMGRRVWSTTRTGGSEMSATVPIVWNMTDTGGRRVPHGIYVCRATVSTDGVKVVTKSKKLAVGRAG